MIAVDTSALMAIVLKEPEGEACREALEGEQSVIISAGTLAEALIVAAPRGLAEGLSRLVDELGFEIVSVTAATARRMSDACGKWGKGVHPAGLNLGDCFAYEVAKTAGCRLLYVGGDFAKTDVPGVLQRPARSPRHR